MSVSLFAAGDYVNTQGNPRFIDSGLLEQIQKCDFAFCNLEAPIKQSAAQPIPKVGLHLEQPEASIDCLANAGFNIVSLANNHIYDYGPSSLGTTLEKLAAVKLKAVGAGMTFDEAYQACIFECNGVRIAFLAAAENEFGCLFESSGQAGYAWLFHPLLEDTVRTVAKTADVIILSAHAGVESVNLPLKEWRDRYRRLCDLGVDVVLGHHPHVPQGYERYQNKWIFYSLGNFYFDTASHARTSNDSYSVILHIAQRGEIACEVLYHKVVKGKVCQVPAEQVNFDLSQLNAALNENYDEAHDKMCIDLYKSYYYRYYYDALGAWCSSRSIVEKVKWVVCKVWPKRAGLRQRNLLLLHNIRIDSHRFVVQRALSLLFER